MARLHFDPEQRFTCQQCGRCCRRGWEIVALGNEVKDYRAQGAARWFRETADAPEGTHRDPFERLRGRPGYYRIRKRPDGACGFLSPDDRCRIHEELGEERKPLTCRTFPFRFHPAEGEDIVSVSYSCPTVVANAGTRITRQALDLRRLRGEWFEAHPERPVRLLLAPGRTLTPRSRDRLRELLAGLLGRRDASSLRVNLVRIGRVLDDLSRYRVRKLDDERFDEYLKLTGGFALHSDKPVPPRPSSRLGRQLQRGFFFAVAAADLQRRDGRTSGLRLGLRYELLRLLAHVHGVGGPVADYDLGAARGVAFDLGADGIRQRVERFLAAAIHTLGTGRFTVLDELAMAASYLNAAAILAAMRAAEAGDTRVTPERFDQGLLEASDLTDAEDRGLLGRFLTTLAGGTEALYVLADAS